MAMIRVISRAAGARSSQEQRTPPTDLDVTSTWWRHRPGETEYVTSSTACRLTGTRWSVLGTYNYLPCWVKSAFYAWQHVLHVMLRAS